MNMKNSHFQTSDYTLAVSLCCLGFPVDSLDCTNPQRVEFCFEREEGLDEAVKAFWKREIRVEPMTYATHSKLLKSRLFDARKK